MFSWLKSLRISLPIATGASAIIATALLISWTNDKDKLKKDESDEILKDLEKTAEEFKDETITKADEDQQSEKELDKKETKDGKDQTEQKNKANKEEEPDSERGKELVKKLLEDASQINIGDTTQRGNDESEKIKLPPTGGSTSEEPLEEKGVPPPAETEAIGSEGPTEEEGVPAFQGPKEESDELLGQEDLPPKKDEKEAPMEEAEGDTIQEEEEEVGAPDDQAQDTQVPSGEPLPKEEEDRKVEAGDGKEKPSSEGQEGGRENAGRGEPSGDSEEESDEHKGETGDKSSGSDDGSEHGNNDTTSWDIDKLTGLLNQLDGQKNSLSAKLANLLQRG